MLDDSFPSLTIGYLMLDDSLGFPYLKIDKFGGFTKFIFHVFDIYEIHIQAFVHFINGKLMSGHSSSSTFHHFQEFIISNYQKNRNCEFKNSENVQLRFPKF